MYIFLRHLYVLDRCLISVTIPKSIHNSLKYGREIFSLGCAFQVFAFILCVCAETPLLTAMSFYHYAAISLFLLYWLTMDDGAYGKMAATSWFFGSLSDITHSTATFSVPVWRSNVLPQFFCDIPQLIGPAWPTLPGNLTIADAAFGQRPHTPMYFFLRNVSILNTCCISVTIQKSILNSLIISRSIYFRRFQSCLYSRRCLTTVYATICRPLRYAFLCNVCSLLKISCSEMHIVINVSVAIESGQSLLHLPAPPHLVTLFISTGSFTYLKHMSDSPSTLDLLVDVLYTTTLHTMIPLNYNLKNRDMKAALRNARG
ncbi:putative olfactory receptor 14L1 [Tachyglossus aculeatus]|uniref:putative olfactory receptor 14L1 n=1 Tax=Tachyglossus aculeatus TaxID=9261 RepID=UPI0018F32D25|nr:putative olfactory receptor 14L1 [Tachyglossus aculeatus]